MILATGIGRTPRLPFDSTRFVNNYIGFVKLVKSKYPQARIALLSSPMLNGSKRELLQHCLTAVKNQVIDRIYPTVNPLLFIFSNPCRHGVAAGHPNVEDHAILAGN